MPDGRPRFPFARPDLPPPAAWLDDLQLSYEQRWFSNGGPLVRRLEGELARRDPAGGRDAVVVASATAGLVATLIALGLDGPVALPAFTFPASAHAVAMAGCTPVLCDVDPLTWELSPAAAAHAVREHGCVAIMHVRAFGLCRDLAAIERVADAAGVPLVVDSAAAYGGATAGREPLGRAGIAEVFSAHATKVFAAGEGGFVLAAPELAAAVRRAGNFALDGLEVTGRGLNAKLSELSAAVMLAALEQLDDVVERRRATAAALLAAARASGLPFTLPDGIGQPPWQGLPLLLPSAAARDGALSELRRAGVEARPYYAPGLQRTRAFARCADEALPVTDELSERMLCLPVYSRLEPGELELLAGLLTAALTTTKEEHGLSRR
ncbi:DegT/DnrJ/EryC1/StrS family aminotransferase [Conexibacter stalactiti]|uniref:DegT/DnrJ/EryC1/StrS family aminotransferase n=1 Tax=Conexibacter stalactiti TaxID=1940611 RepID=A0ABU4HK37_9ACTN|nr:DegT/DnrJ/EryC1/StrS family aminotransferase [Conexibacter stalactiti]MDW5593665.1 DegT/DnrJ/EryC1/StrS family aminotransferase [Conexibacter stalactiti]MEC5034306.1 DegT/DnrJ/EryC1/StrS family aminotransferase [Conexibacter stalactiti]